MVKLLERILKWYIRSCFRLFGFCIRELNKYMPKNEVENPYSFLGIRNKK